MVPLAASRFVRNAGWLFLLQGVNIVLPFVTVPYVTRVLGADAYGTFAIALNWATYFQLVIEFGFDLSASKKVVGMIPGKELDRLVSTVVAARLLLVALCFAAMLAMAALGLVDGAQLACMLVLFSMLLGYALQLNWLFIGLQDMKVITISTAAARATSVALVFLMVRDPSQLVLYAFLYSVTFMVSAALTHLFARRRHGVRLGRPSLRGIGREMRDGTPIFLSNATSKIISNVGVTVLGACQSAAVVGSYAAILKIPQMASLMFSPVSQALYPRVNEVLAGSRRDAVRLVAKVAAPVLLLFAAALAAIAAFRVPVVSLLFGEGYLECADALVPLCAWVLLGIANNFMGVQLLIPFGHQRLYSALVVADSLLCLVLNVALGTAFGAMGTASAVAASELVLSVALVCAHLRVRRARYADDGKETL